MDYRTEEEQLEALKNWWKKNGGSLLVGVALALAIVFGWKGWQNHQANQRAAAASHFNDMLDALNNDDSKKRMSSMDFIASQMRKDYGSSVYTVFANLLMAKEQVQQKQFDKALDSLSWAQKHVGEKDPLRLVVDERLARAQFAANKPDAALNTLQEIKDPGSFAASYKELEGDILKSQGKTSEAIAAYKAARKAAGDTPSPILDLKLSDLAGAEGS
ncbi:YfgM family protein [Mangrovitalea sediminis]|uniref:YfgM family protein n=1 Tax=Mangrovitalea sediminis TaxID=1982043 RepID=UPI000BE4F299|nr:tetratricopeptide repeat protein [Mangrovitalea sediminis]